MQHYGNACTEQQGLNMHVRYAACEHDVRLLLEHTTGEVQVCMHINGCNPTMALLLHAPARQTACPSCNAYACQLPLHLGQCVILYMENKNLTLHMYPTTHVFLHVVH
jgi:hypothetical protein